MVDIISDVFNLLVQYTDGIMITTDTVLAISFSVNTCVSKNPNKQTNPSTPPKKPRSKYIKAKTSP
jgi:hypothetical protein